MTAATIREAEYRVKEAISREAIAEMRLPRQPRLK